MRNVFFCEKHCKKCGKNFIPAPQHIYKDHKGVYCSWTCYNHRKECDEKPRVIKNVVQYTKDGELLAIYKTAVEAASVIGGVTNALRFACREEKVYKGYLWKYIEVTENG